MIDSCWCMAVVQSLSHVQLFETPWTAPCHFSFTISWSLLKLMSIESIMPSNHLILCHPLLLLPSIFLNIGGFSNESVLHIRMAKVLELQLQHQSFNEYSGLISFRMIGSPCSPRDSQEYSPAPQFESINSSVLSFLHCLTLTSIRDLEYKIQWCLAYSQSCATINTLNFIEYFLHPPPPKILCH